MTFDEYRKIDAVNFSTLKEARRSLRHYQHIVAQPREDTARLAVGRAAHTAILEPDRFLLDYALFSGARRAGEAWNECCRANKGKTILREDEYLSCLAMRDAVRAHPVAAELLKSGKPEQTITWTDEATGLACKARIDWLGTCLLDLKTTTDVDAQRFGATAARLGYHGQLAFYMQGLRANGILDTTAKILAVEVAAPHDVAVFAVDDDALWAGEEMVRELLAKVAAGKKENRWPGRYPAEERLALPGWCFTPEDDSGLDLVIGGEAA